MADEKVDFKGRRDSENLTKSPTDALLRNAGKGDPEVIKYFLLLIAYLFILLFLINLFSSVVSFILWIAIGFAIYKLAEKYGQDIPWISNALENLQNIGFTSTSTEDSGPEEDNDVDGTQVEEVATLDNYAEKFDEWRVTKETVSAPFVSAGDKIRNFSFNSSGLYKVRLWMLLILVPLLVWIIMWDIVSWPFLIWFSFWFSFEDATNLSRICSLILSYFIIIRIYSHCTNNRNLPINSDMMSDFDDYTVSHLFRFPTDKNSLILTGKALLFDFIGGYLLLIFTSIYAMQSYDSISRFSLEEFKSEGYHSFIFTFLAIAVFVPILEELMFRGFVLDLASESYGRWGSILISAILFAIIHPLYILSVLNAFWAGLIYGYLRITTNSLWPPILLHSLWNGHIILLAFYS